MTGEADHLDGSHHLEYAAPAREWTEALPLGNGRIGAMCFGGIPEARFQINDATAWSGTDRSELASATLDADDAARALVRAREALARGDHASAEAAVRLLQGRYTQAYQPFADLRLTLAGSPGDEVVDYERRLDLTTGEHVQSGLLGGVPVTIRAFVSHPAQALVVRVESATPLEVQASLSSPHRVRSVDTLGGVLVGTIRLPSDVAPGHEPDCPPVTYGDDLGTSVLGALLVGVDSDGLVRAERETLSASGATRTTFVLTTATTFTGLGRPPTMSLAPALTAGRSRLSEALAEGWRSLRDRHVRDHGRLYGATVLHLGAGEGRTDARLARAGSSVLSSDPSLFALVFHYARYLLIASSRTGSPPANLQGIWNDQRQPPWSGNYTTNINLQMNYWLAETTGLRELHEPLVDLLAALADRGQATASRLYRSSGWVCHHNTDAWAFTHPVGMGRGDNSWAWWPMAGPWLVAHLRMRAEFGPLDDHEARQAWDIAAGAARFVLDWLVGDGDGGLVSPLATSPENVFRGPEGEAYAVTRGTALDDALARELFDFVVSFGREHAPGDPLIDECAQARERLAPILIRDGMLAEWHEAVDEVDPHHRHLSHLYPVFPGTERLSADEAAAAAESLRRRGDESTGWSLVWRAALWARLGDTARPARHLSSLFRAPQDGRAEWAGALYPNLFQSNPPFQIDANLGFAAAVAEMLVQSHRGSIELLPGIDEAFPDGEIRGLVARPGVAVDVAWSQGRPTQVSLTASSTCRVKVAWRGIEVESVLPEGRKVMVETTGWSRS